MTTPFLSALLPLHPGLPILQHCKHKTHITTMDKAIPDHSSPWRTPVYVCVPSLLTLPSGTPHSIPVSSLPQTSYTCLVPGKTPSKYTLLHWTQESFLLHSPSFHLSNTNSWCTILRFVLYGTLSPHNPTWNALFFSSFLTYSIPTYSLRYCSVVTSSSNPSPVSTCTTSTMRLIYSEDSKFLDPMIYLIEPGQIVYPTSR